MLTGLVLSVAISATGLPPGVPVANHASPGKYAQPTIVKFERYEEDHQRRLAWNAYVAELDRLWGEYKAAGRTPAAFKKYQESALAAKRAYVYQDPYHTAVPVSDPCPCVDCEPACQPCRKSEPCQKGVCK